MTVCKSRSAGHPFNDPIVDIPSLSLTPFITLTTRKLSFKGTKGLQDLSCLGCHRSIVTHIPKFPTPLIIFDNIVSNVSRSRLGNVNWTAMRGNVRYLRLLLYMSCCSCVIWTGCGNLTPPGKIIGN